MKSWVFFAVFGACACAVAQPLDDTKHLNQVDSGQPLSSAVELGSVDLSSKTVTVEGVTLTFPNQVERLMMLAKPLWINPDDRMVFQEQLALVALSGVSPLLESRLESLVILEEQEKWHAYDQVATDTLLLYVSYAENISEYGQTWFYQSPMRELSIEPSITSQDSLVSAIEMNALSQFIDYYRPPHASREAIRMALKDLMAHSNQWVSLVSNDGLKRVGDLLPERELIIERIDMAGIDTSGIAPGLDWYDESLKQAMVEFQRIHGLKQDAIIGPKTTRWLNVSPRYRKTKLALNLERARLWDKGNTTQVTVNVPSFEMQFSHSGQQLFESKVVVGKLRRPTPIMETQMKSVVLNPTWNIPWKIMVEDIIPKAKRDPSYLARQGIDIIESWTSPRIISPATINWETLHPRAFPFRMRQRSGYNNALGLYKFNTPNPRAIYLHDTPSKNLFDLDMRAFSSGCIRVEHAEEFAEALLDYQGIERDKLLNSSTNRHIRFNRQIPVMIIYQTAWLEDGVVHYRDDIYDLDAPYHESNSRLIDVALVGKSKSTH
ncbi:L,D-transpeptidase family protein [Vibrio sp. WXL103]|uniref:L,D-transpeptidase family protein n=1 Tax=Vibrio sp. WXL103 TaxID=3450710 RepID=UPI003EC85CF0